MTFSHQMVRLFSAEQLYRANSILNNEPYHHKVIMQLIFGTHNQNKVEEITKILPSIS